MKDVKNKQFTIAVMVGDTQSDYSEELMRGFYAAAREEGVNIVLLMGPQMPEYCTDIVTSSITGNYRYQFNSIYQYTHFIKPDAAVISYGTLSAFYAEQSKQSFIEQFSDIPCIVIEDESTDENVPYICIDNYSGMKANVEHLIVDHGYRKIAFLSGPKNNFDSEERMRAYKDVMMVHGLEVTDAMIAYGDYTDRVDNQVIQLLDQNPGLEAIVCANDGMTKSCYRICMLRNLIVGKDIAITGFDDIAPASSMNPPLTSVSQNSFNLSFTALKRAVALCRGEKLTSESMSTKLKKRCSCGCSPMKVLDTTYVPQKEIESFLKMAITEVGNYIFDSVSYKPDREYLEEALSDFFQYIYDKLFVGKNDKFSIDYLLFILKRMVAYPYLSNGLVLDNITQVLQILLANAKDAYSQGMIAQIISSSQQYVHSLNIENLENEIYMSNRKSWFVPTFTRDLAAENYLSNPKNIFFRVMEEMQKMAVRSAYFFLFDQPVVHEPGKPLDFPEKMNLVSYYNEDEMEFLGKSEEARVTYKNGCLSFFGGQKPTNLTSVLVFSEYKQYGMMICDVDHSDIAFLQICSVQLGTLFHFIELNLLEQQAQKYLHDSLDVIKEQNKILSFISEYDELTKLLNRRGFIEKAFSLYRQSIGRKAYMIFGDLDHLKQINDIYGHAEGDFAIKNIAERFRTILPWDTISGRIGGDEFVSFLISNEEGFEERIKKEFARAGKEFNEASAKPYYIEMSVGIYEFICDEKVGFEEIMKKADKLLYKAKENRRTNVQKEQS